MKKTIIIILALVLILVGGIWLYLLLFGAPESTEDLFADLGFGDATAPVIEVEPTPEPITEPAVEEEPSAPITERLTLLSTTPSVGAVITGSSTAGHVVRYIEQGIGTLYEINLATNQETKVSDTLYEGISQAIWSPDGRYVILVKDAALDREVTLFDTTKNANLDSVSGVTLPPDADNIAFVTNTLFKYTRSDNKGTLGYSYNALTGSTDILFSVPFSSVSVIWGEETLIYNRPSELHPGYAYILRDGNYIEGFGSGGIGLTAMEAGGEIVINKINEDSGYYTGFKLHTNAPSDEMTIPIIPEKCVHTQATIVWCGYPFGAFRADMPNDWYKGLTSLSDVLWQADLATGQTALVENLKDTAGTDIDVINLATSQNADRFVFNDFNTYNLWLYDTTK